MSRSVILNADDFGLSPAVNRGILEAFGQGVLTSTTMLVNLPGFHDAVRIAREHPALGVGVHLSLLWGAPVSPPHEVPSLVAADGCFPARVTTLAQRYLLRQVSLAEVRLEFSRQIARFREAGLLPTHVDTHKHVHALPGVLGALISAAGEHGIDKVRLPVEDGLSLAGSAWPARVKSRLVRGLCRGARVRLAAAGMRTTDHFAGIAQTGRLNSPALNRILSSLRDGVTEIMCHPGHDDDEARHYSSALLRRERELQSLKDPQVKATIAAGAIRLIHYGQL